MRVKEIDKTANVAWSPEKQFPVYVVAGTAAQQLDATFSTTAALEIYHLDLSDSSLHMPLVASIPSEHRFHKVVWGSHGMSDGSSGVIVAGADNGNLFCYDGASMIKGSDKLLFKQDKHVGAVKALDFNNFQSNLLASGASESEIFIWDLNKSESPMTPGAKSQPPEEVSCVCWNKQVQHILASTFGSRCVVWDLRKNEPIIKVSDSMSRIKCSKVAWHPDVPTQMCLSSEDDHTPVIQMWDLRYATSPVKTFENHQRGVLDIAWCPQDSDLLLSCGKDNRILCWNPNSDVPGGEVIYELPTSTQWCFDVQWCPRNPGVISSSSFDGHVSVYSLMGGGHPIHIADKVADSFQSNDPFAQAAAAHQVQQTQNVMPLQKPPKWLRKPVGASFGFGGKLVSFDSSSSTTQQPSPKNVYVSQVVTETELLNSSSQLEQALVNGQYVEFCAMKSANSSDEIQENIWNFLRVNFEKEPREHYIELLGYDKTELARKVAEHISADPHYESQGVDAEELAQRMTQLHTADGVAASGGQASPNVGSKTPGSRDDLSIGNISDTFDDIAAANAQQEKVEQTPLNISTEDDPEGYLCQALLMGNFEAAVELCLCENKMAEAILLAIAGGPELLQRTQKRYFAKNNGNISRLISSVVTQNWSHIVESCDIANWKEALALILTYASSEEFVPLCDTLARRLENEVGGEYSMYASLCYICSGNLENLVQNWLNNTESQNSPLALEDLVEKVMILRKAVELSRGQAQDISGGALADKLNQYSNLLAAQGSLDTAFSYLGNSTDLNLNILKDRLFYALGKQTYGVQAPQCPFQKKDVLPEGGVRQQVRATQPSRNMGQKQQGHTSQAKSTFNTVTTNSTNPYMNPNQYQYSAMNGATATSQAPSYYNPVAAAQPTQPVAPSAISKGPLAHKYPAPAVSSAAYASQLNSYSGPTSQPNMYKTPSVTGGPSNSPSSHSNFHSFIYEKPENCWNDTPLVQERAPKAGKKVPTAPVVDYSNLYNPQAAQAEMQAQAAAMAAVASEVQAPQVQQEVHREPIPTEHQVLQDIFDNLVQSCLSAANNPQMKRKLDDVTRKLELLYGRLRSHSLSQNVILGLHQIIQSIQQGDYNSGLQVYNQMVSHGNFSEISNFMPGLKMLLQSANQLQVYVR
ncbi:protein transport protein Sec31A-like isoform X4 [Mytilus edulis]|uniref:protein transport protein Sec31A-like isoform X4 n=1 Tax=Mytilus edulis TaxID=6550 RepID=UPI0039F1030A